MRRIALTITLLGALAMATVATAGVSVFKTSFSTRSEYGSIDRLSGSSKACKRSWRGKKSLGVTVKGGETHCALSTPVEGDGRKPNLIVKTVAVVSKQTDKKVRKETYVGVAVRADRRGDYELRVFPKSRRFQLVKSGEVLEQGREESIEGLDEKNRLEISAIGNAVTAKANGKRLAEFGDKNAEQVKGRKTALVYGSTKKSKRAEGVGYFDKLKVQVPVP
jgi:hypothetical protein